MTGALKREVWDVAVIGAGVVGLAVAAAVAKKGRRVVVIDRAAAVGQGISSRNSGVIHAGLYYPPGSLKARSCREGRARLVERCIREQIPHQLCGKWVVACAEADAPRLAVLHKNAQASGVTSLEYVDGASLRRREPELTGVAALWSPESGVVDAHGVVDSYRRELVAQAGCDLVLHTEVVGVKTTSSGLALETYTDGNPAASITVERLVNAAGLGAWHIATLAGYDSGKAGVGEQLCKGDYFWISVVTPSLSTRLVYPIPSSAGLGIHLTQDLAGRWRAGPDTTFVATEHYDVDANKAELFREAVARYWPAARRATFQPDFAGIRPKLSGPAEPPADFKIVQDGACTHLLGIESPGLTAAGALAEEVCQSACA